MKIGILTQPLHTNYGGLLQAFALQKVLKDMGHDVITINRVPKRSSYFRWLLSIAKRTCFYFILRKKEYYPIIPNFTTKKQQQEKERNTNLFINKHISITDKIYSDLNTSFHTQYNFNAYVVGSDQVWRPRYSTNIFNYYLDFLDGVQNIKRITYAASFGVDEWEYSEKQSMQCSLLAQKFDAISVREESAVKISNEFLGVNAKHVVDPTLLLSKEVYSALIDTALISQPEKSLTTYILDESQTNNEIVRRIAIQLQIKPIDTASFQIYSKLSDQVVPPVELWLSEFKNAKFIVTDSFHGSVFSIIFNKPFLVIGNPKRGMARFASLLKMFGLEDRLITNLDDVSEHIMRKEIDWAVVNTTLEEEKAKGKNFLKDALKI